MSLPGARRYTFCSFSSVSSTLGSCLSTPSNGRFEVLIGKRRSSLGLFAQPTLARRTKTAVHAARAELSMNRFMVLIDPLADFNKNLCRLTTSGSRSAAFRAVLFNRAYADSRPEKRGEMIDSHVRSNRGSIWMSTIVA